jgi:hypothetical protein
MTMYIRIVVAEILESEHDGLAAHPIRWWTIHRAVSFHPTTRKREKVLVESETTSSSISLCRPYLTRTPHE